MSRLLVLMPILFVPAIALADIAPGGDGCRCSSTTELGIAGIPLLAVAIVAVARRMRRAC